MRILWVENHAAFVRVAGRQFLAGHDLTVVPSVAGARAALGPCTFEAVLVDYDLDDGKGAEVVQLVRQHAVRPVVIAVSSHAESNAALLTAGADAAYPKMQFAGIDAVLRSAVESRPTEPTTQADRG